MVDMYDAKDKIGLSVHEAGWLLQKTESQVRGMLRRGDLLYAVVERKIDPASVDLLIESPFNRLLFEWLLAGRIAAPKPASRYGPPAPLMEALRLLMLASPALVCDRRTGRTEMVSRLADHVEEPEVTQDGKEPSLKPVLSFIM
jgi:hypothetical protein